jgi:hypothetical protein
MGTYAVYQVWVGVKRDDWFKLGVNFVGMVRDSADGVELDGLIFTSIAMHGKDVGIRVVIQELNWECEIGPTNVFNLDICAKAEQTLLKMSEIFKKRAVPVEAKVYHHIDLGG